MLAPGHTVAGMVHADLFASGMRLLLSSADHLQIERFCRILFVAGIQSQVRKARAGRALAKPGSGAELWVENERDYRDAVKLFTEAASLPLST
jgi:hypothetical protein